MAPTRPPRKASPSKRRRHEPEIVRVTQGQLPRLADAVDTDDADPVSQVRPAFPEPGAIAQLFVEAGRIAR